MKLIVLFLSILLASTCNTQDPPRPMTQEEVDARALELNKQMTMNEAESIRKFVEEKDWPMTATGTGLQYWIYVDSLGATAQKGQIAEVSFVLSLMDGTVAYQTKEGETRSFKIEASDVETGLHEGIQYMSVGDQAKFILPSHLAHGLAGDQHKIPLKSTIIYDITLHGLK